MESRTSPLQHDLPTMGKTAANPNPRLHPPACKAFTQTKTRSQPKIRAAQSRTKPCTCTGCADIQSKRQPRRSAAAQDPESLAGHCTSPQEAGVDVRGRKAALNMGGAEQTLPHTMGPHHLPSMPQQPHSPTHRQCQTVCHGGERPNTALAARQHATNTGSPQSTCCCASGVLMRLLQQGTQHLGENATPFKKHDPPNSPGTCVHRFCAASIHPQTYSTCLKTGAARLTPAHADVHGSRTTKAGTAGTTMLRRMQSICWCIQATQARPRGIHSRVEYKEEGGVSCRTKATSAPVHIVRKASRLQSQSRAGVICCQTSLQAEASSPPKQQHAAQREAPETTQICAHTRACAWNVPLCAGAQHTPPAGCRVTSQASRGRHLKGEQQRVARMARQSHAVLLRHVGTCARGEKGGDSSQHAQQSCTAPQALLPGQCGQSKRRCTIHDTPPHLNVATIVCAWRRRTRQEHTACRAAGAMLSPQPALSNHSLPSLIRIRELKTDSRLLHFARLKRESKGAKTDAANSSWGRRVPIGQVHRTDARHAKPKHN
jgi:hypothetical protein